MQKRKTKKGFTLVELLLVIAIIGILAAVLFVGLGNQRERARVTTFKENVRGLVTTYTACTDGGGTINNGVTSAEADGENNQVCSSDNTAGIPDTSLVPAIMDCDGGNFINIETADGTNAGDNWEFTATCERGDTDCEATCQADGCIFDGNCE